MFFEKPKITPLSQEFGSMVRGFRFFCGLVPFWLQESTDCGSALERSVVGGVPSQSVFVAR
jgi:hypothetical protein